MRENNVVFRSASALLKTNLGSLPESSYWAKGGEIEHRIHRIHAYPAKFPAFITTKALEVSKAMRVKVSYVGDVFCGCGTVAYEARRNGIQFWGCDINPVATLIARVKSSSYSVSVLQKHLKNILSKYPYASSEIDLSSVARARLLHWHLRHHFLALAKLKNAIDETFPRPGKYRDFFYCAFSNTLKGSSRWLTKSIKPQVDPKKAPSTPRKAFKSQCESMILAFERCAIDVKETVSATVVRANVLEAPSDTPKLDMIVTSPPYVTSYEYADLHQLSSLWLGYANDYRELRRGSIGSSQLNFAFAHEAKRLNLTGTAIVFGLYEHDKSSSAAIAKYFLDMQKVAVKCHNLLTKGGLALFVIGNTEYKNIHIDNAKHLGESLFSAGFKTVRVAKRRITRKNLTPYRNARGRFTRTSTGRRVYAQEFILIAKK